ncbi:MAG: 1-acyl-sn-glycerol-3-phosphate acyltransferase [Bifidobacteriaceae bacterium]|nr:1-acyl-sn-glycerol-3-phosphate acyltransferase [Bifidobacteriaceae bacterium]
MRKPPVPFTYKVVVAILAPIATLLTRKTWRGRENLPASGGYVVAANHLSNLDFLAVIKLLAWWARPPQVLAKESLFRAPVVGAAMRGMGMIPVHRGTAQAAKALAGGAAVIRAGGLVLVYPEGTVTRDPNLWPMAGRPGAVRLALDTGCPLVPLAQWGAQRILPYRTKRLHVFPPTKVALQIGPPIDLSDLAAWEDRAAAARAGTERLMTALTAMVGELRGETPPGEPYNQFAARGGA